MIVGHNFTEEDKEILEHMLSLRFLMPYQPYPNQKVANRVIHILTPVLYLLSLGCYLINNRVMTIITMTVAIFSTLYIIGYRANGKKFEKGVHDAIYHNPYTGERTAFCDEGIYIDRLYNYSEIAKVFLYLDFFFLITKEKKMIIMKASDSKKQKIKEILSQKEYIEFEERDKPFNIYWLIKKMK